MTKIFKNSKQVLAFVLAFAVIAVSLFTGVVINTNATTAASEVLYWDGTTASSFADTSEGTEGDPIEIASAAELALMVTKNDGKYYKIADGITTIYLQSETNAAAIKAITDGENAKTVFSGLTGLYSWKTSDDGTFNGHFDGNGVQIYGLYAKDISTSYNVTSALFPKATAGSSFKNFAIKNSFVQRFAAVSGVVAQLEGSGVATFENVEISNNYLATTRFAAGYVATLTCGGGNVGLDYSNLLIYGNATYACVGTAGSESTLTAATSYITYNAYNSGETATQYNNFADSIILDCRPIAFNNGNASHPNNYSNVYINIDVTALAEGTAYAGWGYDYSTGVTQITDAKGADGKAAMPALDWDGDWFANAGIPALRALHNITAVDNGDGTHTETCADTGCTLAALAAAEHYGIGTCTACGAALTTPDTLYWNGQYTEPEDSDGDGIYEIDEASDLAYLAYKTQGDKYETYGKTYKVIDGVKAIVLQPSSLSGVKDLTSVEEVKTFFETNSASALTWKVFGYKGEYPFQGTLDGNGATIYGMYNDVANSGTKTNYSGLFGLVDQGAVIKNLGIENSYITTGTGMMGLIAAATANNNAEWNATANVGNGTVTIENCVIANNYTHCTDTAYTRNGIIIGKFNDDLYAIKNCIAYGNEATNASGKVGLVGCPYNNVANSMTNVICLGTTPYNLANQGNASMPDTFINVYTDTIDPVPTPMTAWGYTWDQYTGHITEISAADATGADGKATMAALDWTNVWFANAGLPELRVFHDIAVVDNGDGTHSEGCVDCSLTGLAAEAHTYVGDATTEGVCVCGAVCPHATYDDGETIQAGDCVTDEIVEQFCHDCGYQGPNAVATAAGHQFGNVNQANAPHCDEDGTVAYKTCSVCEKNYAPDADAATTALSAALATIVDSNRPAHASTGEWVNTDPAGHYKLCDDCGVVHCEEAAHDTAGYINNGVDGHIVNCTTCGYATSGNVDHEYVAGVCACGYVCPHAEYEDGETKQAGDCVTDEIVEQFCKECGEQGTDKVTTATGHVFGDVHDAKSGNCSSTGTVAHKTCSVCEKNYAPDADATTAALSTALDTIDDGTILANVHNVDEIKANDATCDEPGNIAYDKCKDCGKLFTAEGEIELDDTIIDATGHDIDAVAEVPATTEKTGVKAHYACSECGAKFADAEGETPVEDADLEIAKLEGGDSGETSPVTGQNLAIVIAVLALMGGAVVVLRKAKKA